MSVDMTRFEVIESLLKSIVMREVSDTLLRNTLEVHAHRDVVVFSL